MKRKINKESRVYKTTQLLKKFEIKPEDLDPVRIKKFKEKCKSLSDTRQKEKVVYKIWDIVVVTFLATLGNADDWEEIHSFAKSKYAWLKSFLQLTGGIPSVDTYERVISLIKPKELENICVAFTTEVLNVFSSKRDIYSIDGKVDKSSRRNKTDLIDEIKPLNVLNVYSKNLGICIASEKIDDKTNEIPNVPIVLSRLNLNNVIVTWDALNTQTENVKAVVDGFGDYVVALKKNHQTFYQDVVDYFDDKRLDIIRSGHEGGYCLSREKNHSSIITYEYFQTEDVKWFYDLKSWIGLRSFGLVVKTTITNSKTSSEKRYYISSLFNNIYLFSDAVRSHWGVENKLHWHLDYTFNQDGNTTMNKNALFNLQIIKKMSLGLLNDAKKVYDCSMKSLRFRLSLDYETEILRLFNILSR
jgi:predicted transposase YbfD/YdcC